MVRAVGFFSLVALSATSYPPIVRGEQPPGIDYVGAGYDLVFGNPDGSEAASSVTDPGFRTHLIKFTWDDGFNTCSGLSSNWTCPKELTIMPQTSCMQQSSSSMVASTKSFQEVLQKDAKLDSVGGPCPRRVDSGFGNVPPMKKTARRLQTDPNNNNDDDDDDDDVNDCACDASVIEYFRFIQLFGTHYTTKVEMGGKIIHRVEIKESDVSLLQSKNVDIAYGASMKASYKGMGASASVSVSASASKSDADKSFEAVKSVAKKELNINVGGSPSEDWREWAASTVDAPMPIHYTLTSLVDLVAKVDGKKALLFELAVADYIAAYGRTLTNTNVLSVEVQYSLNVGTMTSATFRMMIGKTGDMLPAVVVVTKPSGSFRVAVPKMYQFSFDAFVGTVPVTLEYVTGVFTAPKMLVVMEALQTSRKELHLMNMEAHLANKKHKKKAAPVASTPTSIYFNTIQPFTVMSDASLLPLDDQYAGHQLSTGAPWSINPME